MMRFEYERAGERWRASVARVSIPAPDTAVSMLWAGWCKPDRGGERPATLTLYRKAAAYRELAAR
jgi:hypothetical protein